MTQEEQELLRPDERNAELIKTIKDTPYTLVYTEKQGWCILIGRNLIAQGFETQQEAEERINNFTNDYPMLCGTIAAIVKTVIENQNEFNITVKN